MDRRGISPVIATVIIVAVAIAISIAVAFWMTGIVGLFTGFEQVQVTSAYAQYSSSDNAFTITLTVKNTGTSAASIDNVFLNGISALSASGTITVHWSGPATSQDWSSGTSFSLGPGREATITITFDDDTDWGNGRLTHGVSVEVKLHTASGKEYPKLVVLP